MKIEEMLRERDGEGEDGRKEREEVERERGQKDREDCIYHFYNPL